MVKMYLVVIILSTFIFPTETAVIVTVESDLIVQDAVECGQNDIIKCVVSPFPSTAVMRWSADTTALTECFPGSDNDCSFPTVGHYVFTSKPAEEMFNLTFNPVKFSDGSLEFICTDTNTPGSVSPSVKVLPDASTTTIMNSSDTEITVTTGCVYPPDEVTFQWMFYSENGVESDAVSYEYGTSSVKTETSTTCADPDCGGTDVKPRSSTLRFGEASETGNYYFKAEISHSASSGTVAKTIGPFKLVGVPTPVPGPICDWLCILIILIVLGGLYITGIVIGCLMYCQCSENLHRKLRDVFGRRNSLNWLVIIPLCLFIVGFGIITVWLIWKYCCFTGGNGDVKPKEEKSRHETRSGNTRTGQKKPETKKNESKDSGAHIENEQHNQGKKHREQPLPPSGAGAATGTMHGREDSDGAVSRDDVDLQESGRTLPQRPMPDIPRKNERQGHDSKGRGLSANFNDDDHPLIGVNIPTQKAGALEALPEGTGGEGPVKKLKKKKKKSKDQEDEV